MNAIKLLRELNPFAPPPTLGILMQEEFDELQREFYLEDKRADHHRAQAEAIQARMRKLAEAITALKK